MTSPNQPVLVVDDDPELRDFLSIALELDGFEVFTAENGLDALETLRQMPAPCAVLLDLLMPVMNGWEFLAAASHEPALEGVPVVVLSAYDQHAELPQVTDFVEKPFDLNEVIRTIRRAQVH